MVHVEYIYVVYVQYTWCMLIVLGTCLIYVQHTWCMLSSRYVCSVCIMRSIRGVWCVYVVYVEYKWCTRVDNT